MSIPTICAELERIAQNDYMIDDHYLPDGEVLLQASAMIVALQDQLRKISTEET